jgi:Na+-translocating ferredoxin:NAD+ oxidoreductase subunit D
MSEKRLNVSPPPYLRTRESADRISQDILLALVPAALVGIYFYGVQAALIIAVTIGGALAGDILGLRARGLTPRLGDLSAPIAGLILALMLPPSLPLWMGFVAAFLAIVVAKQTFGGLGENIFNPALVGRGLLMLSFPAYMLNWLQPGTMESGQMPLVAGSAGYVDLLMGTTAGWIGSTAAIAPILGGAFLFLRGRVRWETPAAFVVGMGAIVLLQGQDPIFHLLAAGTPFVIFFIVTDSVTTPITQRGLLIWGLMAGVLAGLMRVMSSYPEGTIFAVLLMNALTPLFDTYVRPKITWKEAAQ